MGENKVYLINDEDLGTINFTNEKLFCKITNKKNNINVSWISTDNDFNLNSIKFLTYFDKKNIENNLITNKDEIIKKIFEECNDVLFEDILSSFKIINQDIEFNFNQEFEYLLKNNWNFYYLAIAYFTVENFKDNVWEINDIIISFKSINKFIAYNFWDKYFK